MEQHESERNELPTHTAGDFATCPFHGFQTFLLYNTRIQKRLSDRSGVIKRKGRCHTPELPRRRKQSPIKVENSVDIFLPGSPIWLTGKGERKDIRYSTMDPHFINPLMGYASQALILMGWSSMDLGVMMF